MFSFLLKGTHGILKFPTQLYQWHIIFKEYMYLLVLGHTSASTSHYDVTVNHNSDEESYHTNAIADLYTMQWIQIQCISVQFTKWSKSYMATITMEAEKGNFPHPQITEHKFNLQTLT